MPPTTRRQAAAAATPAHSSQSRSYSSTSLDLPSAPSLSAASTPLSPSTPLNSSSEDEAFSPTSSGASSPSTSRARSPSSAKNSNGNANGNGMLAPSRKAGSKKTSPLGLIPIHSRFGDLIAKHEIPRKVLHVSIGFLGIYLYRNDWRPSELVPPLTACLVPIATADVLRFYSSKFNDFYIRCLGALMRESEVKGVNGVIWYLAGTIAVLVLFPKDVATLSIMLLSWCDTAASTFGRAWGRHTPKLRKGKSLAGTFAAFVVGAATAAFMLGWCVPNTANREGGVMWQERLMIGNTEVTGGWALGLMSAVTGLIASASELVDAFGLDDNVVIPILSGAGVWAVLKLFG